MANYFGAECPACGKTFHENDDIVVCPICGAPHHRACYQQSGKCTFDHLHAQGYMWEPPQPQQQDPETDFQKDNEGKICPTCGTTVAPGTIFCWKCGTPLGENNMSHKMAAAYYTMAFGGVSPEEDILGVSARDFHNGFGQCDVKFSAPEKSLGCIPAPFYAVYYYGCFHLFISVWEPDVSVQCCTPY